MTQNFPPLLAHLPAWLLVLTRLSGIFIYAPMYGSKTIPARVKVFLAVGLSFCVYPALLTVGSPAEALISPIIDNGFALWSITSAIAMELAIGLAIGFGASLPIIAMQMGGKMMDQQMGLGLQGVFNPEVGEQTGIVSEFFFYTALAVFLILGGHLIVLNILVDSFNTIPLGGFRADASFLNLLIGMMTTMFDLALRVAAPLLCIAFLQTVSLGFIMRTVPQMNILSIGFPLRVLLGTIVLVSVVSVNLDVFIGSMRQVLRNLSIFFTA